MTTKDIYARLCLLIGRWADKEITEEFYDELLDEMDIISRDVKLNYNFTFTKEEFNLARTALRIEAGKYCGIARKSKIATLNGDNVASIYLDMGRTLMGIANRMDEVAGND